MNLDVVSLLKGGDLVGKDCTFNPDELLNAKVVAVYFSAHWCPPAGSSLLCFVNSTTN